MDEQVYRKQLAAGAALVSLAGLGMAAYAVAFVIANFTRLVEIGLSVEDVGQTKEQIQAFSPGLYNYVSHVQVNLGAFIAAAGAATAALGWFGLRKESTWAWWTVGAVTAIWALIGVAVHYPYGFGDVEHLGFSYLALALLAAGLYLGRPRQFRKSYVSDR